SQGSPKQLPKYPVSAKNFNKKMPIAKFIQKIITATLSDNIDMSVNIVNESAEDSIEKKLAQLFQMAYRIVEDRVDQLIVDGYEDNAIRTELYNKIFPLIS
ncbi:26944_t:CDS:2, partial [Racocetra persica]